MNSSPTIYIDYVLKLAYKSLSQISPISRINLIL